MGGKESQCTGGACRKNRLVGEFTPSERVAGWLPRNTVTVTVWRFRGINWREGLCSGAWLSHAPNRMLRSERGRVAVRVVRVGLCRMCVWPGVAWVLEVRAALEQQKLYLRRARGAGVGSALLGVCWVRCAWEE